MERIFHGKPYLSTLVLLGILAGFEILFFAQSVLAQAAAPAGSADTDIFKTVQLLSTIFVAISFVAAFVWYVVKGKSNDQLVKNNQDLQISNSELRSQISELKAQKSELKQEIDDIERENERLRKLNLRLQGSNDQ